MRIATIIFVLAIFVCLAAVSTADVIIQKKTSIDNLAGIGGTESSETQYIKADRSYSDNSTKFTSGLMKTMTKGKSTNTIQIIRLDKSLTWNLDPEKKTYMEISFEEMKKMFEENRKNYADSSKQSKEESPYTWTFDVKHFDQTENINGFDCKSILARAIGVNKKDPTDTIVMNYQNWYDANIPADKEIQTFQENYAKAMGIDELAGQKSAEQLLTAYGNQFKQLAESFKDVKGYPIKTKIAVEKPGMAKVSAKKDNETNGESQPSMSGLMGKLGKKMIKKNDSKPEKSPDGETGVFSMTSQVISIEAKPVEDTRFEIPADYKKQTNR